MASDVARFLIETFESSLDEMFSGLPFEFNEVLLDIKDVLNENKNIEETWNSGNISILYRLDNALDDCKLFTTEKKTFLKSLSGTVRRPDDTLKKELTDIRDEIRKQQPESLPSPILPTNRYTYGDPIDASKVVGFDDHKKEIVNRLGSSKDGFIGIGIYGMCGTGKTTLVKYVLQDKEVVDKFKIGGDKSNVVWVCLSDITSPEELDIRIVKHILEELGHETDELTLENPSITDVGLVKKLRDVLQELGNYIIVLDDLWYWNDWFSNLMVQADGREDYKRFFHILPEFKHGKGCGAVIVTTRIKEVAAKMLGLSNLIHLLPSMDKASMEKLVNRTMDQNKEVAYNVDEVVYHCYGLPFVATKSNLLNKQISQAPEAQEEAQTKAPKAQEAEAQPMAPKAQAELQEEEEEEEPKAPKAQGEPPKKEKEAEGKAPLAKETKDQQINSGDGLPPSEEPN